MIVVGVLGQFALAIERDEDTLPGILPILQRGLSHTSVAEPVSELRFAYARRAVPVPAPAPAAGAA